MTGLHALLATLIFAGGCASLPPGYQVADKGLLGEETQPTLGGVPLAKGPLEGSITVGLGPTAPTTGTLGPTTSVTPTSPTTTGTVAPPPATPKKPKLIIPLEARRYVHVFLNRLAVGRSQEEAYQDALTLAAQEGTNVPRLLETIQSMNPNIKDWVSFVANTPEVVLEVAEEPSTPSHTPSAQPSP